MTPPSCENHAMPARSCVLISLLIILGTASAVAAQSPGSATGTRAAEVTAWLAVAQSIAVVLGGVVAGVWGVYQLLAWRYFQNAMDLDCAVLSERAGADASLVVFDVILKNIGRRTVVAHPREPIVFSDIHPIAWRRNHVEKYRYAGELHVKRIKTPSPDVVGAETHDALDHVPHLDRVDLLGEYRVNHRRVDFFMEPGETYHLVVAVRLEPGAYLARITFIGRPRFADVIRSFVGYATVRDFWSRLVYVRVLDSGVVESFPERAGAPGRGDKAPPASSSPGSVR